MSHDHYFRDVSHLEQIDVYRVLKLFGVECPVAQHVVKKALAAGQRGHKSVRRDWQDIADSAQRQLQMLDEDFLAADRAIGRGAGDRRAIVGADVAFETERHLYFAQGGSHE